MVVDPVECYKREIIQQLLKEEKEFPVRHQDFQRLQRQTTLSMREVLIDWLVQVA